MLRVSRAEAAMLLGKKPKQRKPRLKWVAEIDGVRLERGYWVLIIPLPASKNAEPANVNARDRVKKEWENYSFYAWAKAGRPRCSRVEVFPVMFCRVRRDRDDDGAVGLRMKGIIDGLKTHLVPDDNSEMFTLHTVEFSLDRGYPRLELHVREIML